MRRRKNLLTDFYYLILFFFAVTTRVELKEKKSLFFCLRDISDPTEIIEINTRDAICITKRL